MKVVTSSRMSAIESEAYHDGMSPSEFMEEAGSGISLIVFDYIEKYDLDRHVTLICGKGNNGGDAYVAGACLLSMEFDVVAIQVYPHNECSPLCKENRERFIEEGGRVIDFKTLEQLTLPTRGVILDGLFGTGFHGAVEEPYATLIDLINNTRLPIIAIDIPSGLNGNSGESLGPTIIAKETGYLGLPKTGFFLRQGWNHVGKLRYVDFGLPKSYIEESQEDFILMTAEMMKPLLPTMKNDRHKYQAGHVVALAGSPGMPGAALLTVTAALDSGAGIIHLLHPEGMEIELSASPFEIIRIPYTYDQLEPMIEWMNKASCVLIGPGLGTHDKVKEMLATLLPRLTKPSVIDADALTLIAKYDLSIPQNAILTPHRGEMARLLKVETPQLIDETFLAACQGYADEKKITLVLKGGPTFIFQENMTPHVNSVGDPGMATAGSGDVLTGIIASLVAQGVKLHDAACLGVYLHGLSGEFAAEMDTSYCMTASEIISYLPEAFKFHTP